MNQTGLLIALAIAVVAGLAFGLYPQLDLDLVSPFYDPATGWVVGGRGWVLVRNMASWLIALIAAPDFPGDRNRPYWLVNAGSLLFNLAHPVARTIIRDWAEQFLSKGKPRRGSRSRFPTSHRPGASPDD